MAGFIIKQIVVDNSTVNKALNGVCELLNESHGFQKAIACFKQDHNYYGFRMDLISLIRQKTAEKLWHTISHTRRLALSALCEIICQDCLKYSSFEIANRGSRKDNAWLLTDMSELGTLYYDKGAGFIAVNMPAMGASITGSIFAGSTVTGLSLNASGTALSTACGAGLVVKDNEATQFNIKGESNMADKTKAAIKEQTLVFGVPFDSLTDTQMYDIINDLKTDAEKLQTLKVKPKGLRAKIAQMEKDVDALVALVDKRYDEQHPVA